MGRDIARNELMELGKISTHTPAWGATEIKSDTNVIPGFQLTRPRGARPVYADTEFSQLLFQLTRPRGARHADIAYTEDDLNISTHTPAWGATDYSVLVSDEMKNFNSHARVGRDTMNNSVYTLTSSISTHTPAWGATVKQDHKDRRDYRISTHTPAWGATIALNGTSVINDISTHTPAWGATIAKNPDKSEQTDFNSHARVGRDPMRSHSFYSPLISTHTPAWGATGR